MHVHTLRLLPGQDLRSELENLCTHHQISAGIVLTAVGSLRTASLRFAGADQPSVRMGPFEILALSGLLSLDGVHLHLTISDSGGKVSGGHLTTGCEVFTTAEIAIGVVSDTVYLRKHDEATGYKELVVRRKVRK